MKNGVKNLCEAIVLQSMEDVLSEEHLPENIHFLLGDGMAVCSSIIGLNRSQQKMLLDLTLEHIRPELFQADRKLSLAMA